MLSGFNFERHGFHVLKSLGQGSYGAVYKVKRFEDQKIYAIKIVNIGKLTHEEVEDAVNEVRLTASFSSPFIISFYQSFADNHNLAIVTEYAPFGDLSHLLGRRKKKGKPLKEEIIWRYLLQIIEGLYILHSHGIVHRDLKSANILIIAPDLVKIADLGISTVLHSPELAKTQIGTPFYVAPEVWKKNPYNQKCDIWSLGVILYEMMTFSVPFTGHSTNEIAHNIVSGRYSNPTGYSRDLLFILHELLQVDPAQRPSILKLRSMKAIQEKLFLMKEYSTPAMSDEQIRAPLMKTIKVPPNVRNIQLPTANYGQKRLIVKQVNERIHIKKSPDILNASFDLMSTNELRLISDNDLWEPATHLPIVEQPRVRKPLSSRAPRRYKVPKNPRFRRLLIP